MIGGSITPNKALSAAVPEYLKGIKQAQSLLTCGKMRAPRKVVGVRDDNQHRTSDSGSEKEMVTGRPFRFETRPVAVHQEPIAPKSGDQKPSKGHDTTLFV